MCHSVRTYKPKNPYCIGTKLSIEAFEKVLEGFVRTASAKRCAAHAQCSQTTVQRVYTALGERVYWLVSGNLPDFKGKHAVRLIGNTRVRNALVAQACDEPVWSQLTQPGKYAEYLAYRERDHRGVVEGENKLLSPLQLNAIYDVVCEMNRRRRGLTAASFHRHFAVALLWAVLLEVLSTCDVKFESTKGSIVGALVYRVLRISLLETPLRPSSDGIREAGSCTSETREPLPKGYKNPYCKNAKISAEQFQLIVFGFVSGAHSSEEMRSATGLSRQTIQRTTQALGEYVHQMLEERRFPSFETPQAVRFLKATFRDTFKPLRPAVEQYLDELSYPMPYEEFFAYYTEGEFGGDDKRAGRNAMMYSQTARAWEILKKRRGGLSRDSYRRLVALVRFKMVVERFLPFMNEPVPEGFARGSEFATFIYHQVLMLALVDRPLEPAQFLPPRGTGGRGKARS